MHGKPGPDGLPAFREVLMCLYGGLETKRGTPFGYQDADYVIGRMVGRLEQR